MNINLRRYQDDAVNNLRAGIGRGVRNQILCAPTGAGKTLVASYLMQQAAQKGKRCLFLVDRLSLLDQTSRVLDEYGIPHGVIQAGHWRHRMYERVQVCSQQTLARRDWPEADFIIVDEAHTVTETVKQRILQRDVPVIGLTATPFTKGLGKIYDELVNVTTTDELIAQGFLSPYRIFAPSAPDMTGVKVVAGEWEEKESSKRALQIVGDVVQEYRRHAFGKKFICSAVDVAHVEELQTQFAADGVPCAAYTYKVDDTERRMIVDEFRKPDSAIRGLITVTAASKGFDVPDIEVVIVARPLRTSLAEFIQFFGRGLRTSPGKTECLVLDHSGNCERFWDEWQAFFAIGATELDDGRKKEKKKAASDEETVRKCPTCKHVHKPAPFCPACGYEYPRRASTVQHKAGTLTELVASGNRKALSEDMWPQVCGWARQFAHTDSGARKLALATFRSITGAWPIGQFETTESKPVTPEVMNKIRGSRLKWSNQKRKAAAAGESASV